MQKTTTIIATLLLLSAALATAQTGNELLQQAQKKLHQDSDFQAAIQIYDRILREFGSDRMLTATATIDRAKAKELSARVDARKEYEQILGAYADQPAVIEAVRKRMDEVAFPSGIYVAEFDQRTGAVRGPVARSTKDWETVEQFPAWSRDGESLAIRRTTEKGPALVVWSIKTGREKAYEPQPNDRGPAYWASDASAFLTLRGASNTNVRSIFRVDPQGNAREIFTQPVGAWISNLVLSPDEKTLYAHVLTGNDSFNTATIVSFDLATGQRERAFSLPPDLNPTTGSFPLGRQIAISPDGKTLAVIRRPHLKDAHLALVSTRSEDYRELVTGAGPLKAMTWTSDGRSIVFANLKPNSIDTWQLMQIPAQGGAAVFTGLEVMGLAYLDISPDGSRIAFDGMAYNLSAAGAAKSAEK